MNRFVDFLFGTSEFTVRESGSPGKTSDYAAELSAPHLLLRLGVEHRGIRAVQLPADSQAPEAEDASPAANTNRRAGILFTVRRQDERRVREALTFAEFSYSIKRRGIPHIVERYRRRPGILLGLILFFFLLFASQNFIWDIKITGNEVLTDGEILEMLEEDGVKIGSYLPSLDLDALCVGFVRRHGEVSWISVNMMGTVAEVELREYSPGAPNTEQTTGPSSLKALVAARDGIVERLEIYGGTALVQPMQVVRKGELLISCVTQTERRFKLEDAAGLVYAKTERTLTVEIPVCEQVTLPKETESVTTGIEILGKTINFPGRGSIFPPECDTIEEKERFVLFGKLPLPIFFHAVRENVMEEQTVTRTPAQLREEADARMAALVEEQLHGADILQSSRAYRETEEGCRLTLTITCLENIAVPLEIKSDVTMG